jgi:hypothetical protein
MVHPLSRYASPPSRGATPTAWQSQIRGVCSPFALVRQVPNTLEN